LTVAKNPVSVLETPRLICTPLSITDFAEIRLLHGDPRVMATLSADGKTLSESQTVAFLERAADHWREFGFGLWMLRDRTGDDFVGYGGIKHATVENAEQVELAYAIRFDWQRKGFATEVSMGALRVAFEQLRLDRVVAFTLPHNIGSRGVMEHCGFVYQRDIVHAGLPHVLYSLDASAFAKLPR
jgi:[ribosomal protein S5]-alanine N-acetyltransferase